VLAARTLGQLREQVADLPAPPPTFGDKLAGGLRYSGRALRHPAGIVLAVVALVIVLAIIGGSGSSSQSASGVSPAVTVDVPTVTPPSTASQTQQEEHIRDVNAGATAVDDRLAVRVRRIRRSPSVALRYDNPNRLFAGPGHVYAVVDVDYANRASQSLEPFCGETGARLFSRAHRAYEPVDGEYQLEGNDAMCGGGIEPDERAVAHLLFRVPKGTRFAWIELWNGEGKSGDILGKTRLRMHLDGIPGA
jgi:hypothetical protein